MSEKDIQNLTKVTNKEIARKINKTDSAISYVKKNNANEFKLLRIGVLVDRLNIDEKDLVSFWKLKQNLNKEM